jgi:hypothetical protein
MWLSVAESAVNVAFMRALAGILEWGACGCKEAALHEQLDPGERLEMRFSPLFHWLLAALGMGQNRTGVVLTPLDVQVRAGSFGVTISREQIASVRECSSPWWAPAGVHTNFRGRWIVDGGPGRLVRLELSPPALGKNLGLRISIKRLDLGLEDNAGFMSKLGATRLADD